MLASKFIPAVTGLAMLLALSAPAVAGSFSISPLRVDFTATSSTAALTVRNEEAAPVVVQTQPYEGLDWSGAAGDPPVAAPPAPPDRPLPPRRSPHPAAGRRGGSHAPAAPARVASATTARQPPRAPTHVTVSAHHPREPPTERVPAPGGAERSTPRHPAGKNGGNPPREALAGVAGARRPPRA